jgi:hypothetical protein
LNAQPDALGVSIGLGVLAIFDTRIIRSVRVALVTVAVISFAVIVHPVAVGLSAYAAKRAAFPNIADYRHSFDKYFLIAKSVTLRHTTLPAPWSNEDDEMALDISFGQGIWPGIEYVELEPNWVGYKNLLIDLTNSMDSTLAVNVRIHDKAHNLDSSDRYNTQIFVPPKTRSVQRLKIEEIRNAPSGRPMELSEISGLILFVDGTGAAGAELLVSRIWLE